MTSGLENKHADRAHSVLSASSSSRWLNCTPSARMSEGLESAPSKAADEGTLAHEYSENLLRYKLKKCWSEKDYNNKLRELRANPLYTPELDEQVEPYITLILEQVSECKEGILLIEEKVSLEKYIPEGFGTCDCIIVSDGIMYITDLKFGKGVRVSAVDNTQLKLYALGALEAYGHLYDIQTVRLTISQPRLDAVSSWDIDIVELLEWAEDYVMPQAVKAYAGEGDHVPGEWCRFCKAKPTCPALMEEARMLADEDFSPNDTDQHLLGEYAMEVEEGLLEIYEMTDRVKDYLDAVSEYVRKKALQGHKWPGYKIVKSSKNRTIQDEQAAIQVLKKAKVDEAFYLNKITKLKGLGDLKKYLGEKRRDELIGHLIIKPEGSPILVHESDKREEYNGADDFL